MKDDLSQVILFLLEQTSRKAKQFSQKELDKQGFGITVDQWVVLKVIESTPGLSQRELAEKSIKDPASVTRILDLLEKKELIRRIPIAGNRRQYEIHLSAKGRQFIENHMPSVIEQRARSLKGFSEKEIKDLKAMLLRIQDNMT